MIRYVDTYRGQFGVELICRVLGNTEGGFMTSRGYRAAKSRLVSDRVIRDPTIRRRDGTASRRQLWRLWGA
jgi:putative transposase